jgi:hypothetical protein
MTVSDPSIVPATCTLPRKAAILPPSMLPRGTVIPPGNRMLSESL